jgi:hypothetical protein
VSSFWRDLKATTGRYFVVAAAIAPWAAMHAGLRAAGHGSSATRWAAVALGIGSAGLAWRALDRRAAVKAAGRGSIVKLKWSREQLGISAADEYVQVTRLAVAPIQHHVRAQVYFLFDTSPRQFGRMIEGPALRDSRARLVVWMARGSDLPGRRWSAATVAAADFSIVQMNVYLQNVGLPSSGPTIAAGTAALLYH